MRVGSRWWYTSLEESGSLILLPQGVAEPGQVTDGGGVCSVQLKIAPPASVTLNNGAVTHRYCRNRTHQSTVTHRYDVTTVTVTPPLRLLPLHLRNRTYQSTVTHRYDVTTVTVTPPLRLPPLLLRNRTYQSTVTHRYHGNYRYRYPPLPLRHRYFYQRTATVTLNN